MASPSETTLTAPHYMAKAVAGTISGLTAAVLCSPLDVAKTRIQVQSAALHGHKYSGVLTALLTIYREEGFRGWYQGLAPMMCSVGVFWCCYFPCYDYSKSLISAATSTGADSPLVHMAAAGVSGLFTDVVTNPLWVVRTRLATQVFVSTGPPVYESMLHAFRKIAREEGYSAFFAGLRASFLGLSHIMIQFPLYEQLKTKWQRDRAPSDLRPIIAASAFSKLVASSVTYPHEVVRARLQFDQKGTVHYTGIFDVLRKTIRADGVRGLWQGFALNTVRTIPQCIVTFTLYELLSKHLTPSVEAAGKPQEKRSSPGLHVRGTKHVLAYTRTESR